MISDRPRRRHRTVTAILDAAEDVFRESGLAGATMDDIALRAGVARATLYYNFASKDDIAVSIAERYRAVGYAALKDREAQGARADALLFEFFAYAGEWTAKSPEIAAIGAKAALEGRGRSPDRPATRDALADVVALGQAQGLFREDIDARDLGLILGALVAQTALVGSAGRASNGAAWATTMLKVVIEGMRAGPREAIGARAPRGPVGGVTRREKT